MKKLILIITTFLVVLSSLIIFTSARDEDGYNYVMQFEETKKAYPIYENLDDCIGLKSYYQVDNMSYSTIAYNGDSWFNFVLTSNKIYIESFSISGSYPHMSFRLPTDNYDDVGFAYINNNLSIIVFIDGVPDVIDDWYNITDNANDGYYSLLPKNEMYNDYYVQFPVPVTTPSEPYTVPILEALGDFVSGIGVAFGSAFTTVFLVNGQPNVFAIVLLIFFGLALGYGVVRFIFSLFRKEAN